MNLFRAGRLVSEPLPGPTKFSLQVLDGMKVQSDGRLGLVRMLVKTSESRVVVAQMQCLRKR